MPIKQLTDEQIQTWTLEQKDQWWLDNVYRGDMPQLTWRSAVTGAILGMILSVTNLYIAIRTGWTLGVGITSVIMSYAIYKVLSKFNASSEMTILENNAMQSIATSAGYTVSPLVASLAGYMMVTGVVIPKLYVYCWLVVLGTLGTLFAFPLKKRAINDEQMPFPEGYAAGVVLDNLHSSMGKEGMMKAKLLMSSGALAAFIEFLRSDVILQKIRLGFLAIPHYWDELVYKLFTPAIMGTPLKDLTIRMDSSIVMMGTGMLMNLKTTSSMMLGALFNYAILAPIMMDQGVIVGGGFKNISIWALWGGAAMMTTSALYSFFAADSTINSVKAFVRQLGKKEKVAKKKDILEHIELPLKYSIIGIPVLTVVTSVMAKNFFGVDYWLGFIAVPMVFLLSIMAVKSTGLTAITPLSAIAKITQVIYALLAPGDKAVSLITAGITSNVSASASNLLMDIKPAYMLGGKPRHQAVGHVIGIVFGAMAVVPVFYLLFGGDVTVFGTEKFPMPSALVWKAVAEVLADGLSALHPTAQLAVLIGAVGGVVIEMINKKMKGKFPLSAVGFGIAFVLRFVDVFSMFLGSFLFWYLKSRQNKDSSESYNFIADNNESIGAGIIAGGALVGITLLIIETSI